MYQLNSKETCWMISLGIGEIPKRFYCIKPNSFLKIGFDTNVKTNDDRKEERAKLIERITRLLTEGKGML